MINGTRRSSLGSLVTVLVIMVAVAGCGNKEKEEALTRLPPSSTRSLSHTPTAQPTVTPTIQATPTIFTLGRLFDPSLDLKAGPVEVPLELQIPSLSVTAPMLGVGITPENGMDAPKGPIDDPVWRTAFWYRGSGLPGDPGTATIAGHVDDPLGRPEIFAHLQNLHPGDLIIIHVKNTTVDIRFTVVQVKVYTLQESSDPAVLAQIFGIGPVTGTGPQPAPDGLSHLTLITCAGNIINGEFDHHTIVYAVRS